MPTEEVLNVLDAAAIHRHDRYASRTAHTILAEKIWGALRDLGVARGRMLVTGPYAATLAGVPAPAPRAPGARTDARYRELTAAIPPVWWPHQALRLAELTMYDPAQHDVVIANVPLAGLHPRSVHGTRRIGQVHRDLLAQALARTFPGGVLVAITARQILDHPATTTRRFLFTQKAQLLGAVRLPGTVLHHHGPDEASPVDVLVLRRPLPHETPEPADCLRVDPVDLPGGTAHVNEWYAVHHPDHVIGQPRAVTDPDRDGTQYTVDHGEVPWDSALETALAQITRDARDRGLTAVSASWNPPDSRLAPQADWSARATTRSTFPGRPDGTAPCPGSAPGM
ncbi:hypothetical protein APR04_003850 [Promicromonospora umidemergens]|uniref:Uncharacterized protein n=2 Tax=Promicromonospora TaxID=43676 RepID=A0ABP8XGM9_9MICO|nr:hypothetical protein [Promicromonospora umidemergens]MCP2284927.1 hypothetical protein [Promicromonospora umidemergens]